MGRTGSRNALQLLPCRGCWKRFSGNGSPGCTPSSVSCADGADWTAAMFVRNAGSVSCPLNLPAAPFAENLRKAPSSRPGYAPRCAETAPSFEEARAAYVNEGALRELLLAFKYAGAVHLAGTFARMMAEAVRGNPHWFGGKKRLLVPVPMAPPQAGAEGVQPGAGTGGAAGERTGLALCRGAETPA